MGRHRRRPEVRGRRPRSPVGCRHRGGSARAPGSPSRERLAWGPAWGPVWGDSGKVFTRENGEPLHPAMVSDRFHTLVIAAGLPPVRLHDLRHGAASLMLAAGVDLKVVQETLGHSSITITSDTYTSVYPAVAAAATDAAAALVPRAATSTRVVTSLSQRGSDATR
jgi:integrase